MAAHLTDYSDLPVEEPCPDTLAATLEKATGKDRATAVIRPTYCSARSNAVVAPNDAPPMPPGR